jgi:hypothetical protein
MDINVYASLMLMVIVSAVLLSWRLERFFRGIFVLVCKTIQTWCRD